MDVRQHTQVRYLICAKRNGR